ncbi:hypothetical protein [Pectinatus brassicae]|uniref:Uncharacterized protein n=1 Tax=Pectinatus brassicae TaxID=862415 RepID=A0A840UTE1_9FIRM|nr:hypothetical protein [Pectinatus brassicae]MBB5336233.1 hypothetical protein [Pectinatus brassicae]
MIISSKKKLRILSTALCISLAVSNASLALADSSITTGTAITANAADSGNALQNKLSSVEKAVYGTPQTGAIIDRINKLEHDYYGRSQSTTLVKRIDNLYDKIFNNDYAPSAIAQMNGVEWSLMNKVSMQPINQRLSDLETTLYGQPKEGTFYNRMLDLGKVAFGSSQQAIPLSHTLVPANTLIKIKLVTPVNSENMKAGDEVKYQVAENVVYNGNLVFAAGALGEGHVTKVTTAKNFGRDGKIDIDFEKTQAFDGTLVDTVLGDKAKEEMKSEAMAAGASIAGIALLGPIGIVGGLFVHGKDINLPAGTELFIQTKSDINLFGVHSASADDNSTLAAAGQTVEQTNSTSQNILNERSSNDYNGSAVASDTATLNQYKSQEDMRSSL